MYPFKAEMLKLMEKQKLNEDAETIAKKERIREQRKKNLVVANALKNQQLAAGGDFLLARKQQEVTDSSGNNKRSFYRELKKVIEASDVIIEVLDARDPIGSRCRDIELRALAMKSQTTATAKKIILVLNKIDLVPAEVVSAWLKILRREFPTFAFKSSTQEQKHHIAHASGHSGISTKLGAMPSSSSSDSIASNKCVGGEALLQLLKNYARSLDVKTSISVGIVGYPNVGKSSLINSLKRSRAVGVAPTPGFTKTLQEVRLDKQIRLIDSPGVIFASVDTDPTLLLRNCIRVEQLDDPVHAVSVLVGRCGRDQLMQVYSIPAFNSPDEFLLHVAQRKGKLLKGGIVDLVATAKVVLQEWNAGKIPYYALPPADVTPSVDKKHTRTDVVGTWGAEFDIDALLEENNAEAVSSLPSVKSSAFVPMESGAMGHLDMDADMDGSDEEMEDEDDEEDEEDDEDEEEEEESEMDDEMEAEVAQPEQRQFQLNHKLLAQQHRQKNVKMAASLSERAVQVGKGKKAALDPVESALNPQHSSDVRRDAKKGKKDQRRAARGDME
jgi:nuclear GTP-binding protein